jgi:hypothetical protein
MSETVSPFGLVAEAHQALRDAHRRLLDPTPQSIDCSRAALSVAIQRLTELRGLLQGSRESGRGLLPAMTELNRELKTVTLLLQSAALHQSNLLQRMLQASAVDSQYSPAPVELGQRLQVNA